MDLPDPIHAILDSGGYRSLGDEHPQRDGRTWAVLDDAGSQWMCSATTVQGPQGRVALEEAATELASGRHSNVVPIHDLLTTGNDVVIVWACGVGSQSLGCYRSTNTLDLAQVSAALIAAGRGLASLRTLDLGLGTNWVIDDLILNEDGVLQVLPGRIAGIGSTGSAEDDLRQIARTGQVLLAGLGAGPCAELAHLLTATAFDAAVVDPGTFAALCHELVKPATAQSWVPPEHVTQKQQTTLRGAQRLGQPVPDADGGDTATKYAQIARTWRDHVRDNGADKRERRFAPLAGARWARREPVRGRHSQDLPERRQKLTRGHLAVSAGAFILIGALAPLLTGGDDGEGAIAALPDPTARVTGVGPGYGTKSQQRVEPEADPSIAEAEGGPEEFDEQQDPAAAAMALTEARIRLLNEFLIAGASAQGGAEQQLAAVLVPGSPAMAADLTLVSHLIDDGAQTTEVAARARAARTLQHEGDSAVVEVSYDLLDPEASSIAQSATLSLTLVGDEWRVSEVSGASPTERQL